MLENLLKFLVQVLILLLVIALVYYIGTIVIAAIAAPAWALLIWQVICALVALIGVIQISRPILPWP